jgi:FtsZ-interacting cell division protein ZipA
MRKLLGLIICVGVCAVLGLGPTGCTKPAEKKEKDVVKKESSVKKDDAKKDDAKKDDMKKDDAKKDDMKKDDAKKDDAKKDDAKKDDAKKDNAKKDDAKKDDAKKDDAKAKAEEMTHEGTVVSATAKKLVMKGKGDAKEHEHTLAATAKVTCDGKDCKLEDLKAGLRVRVTTVGADMTATRVEALDKNKDF